MGACPKEVEMDKSPESERTKSEFMESFGPKGYETFKRESFLRWRDQEVYLVQKDDFSSVMFVKVLDVEDKCWRLNKELFESFVDLAESDDSSGLVVVLLDSASSGYVFRAEDFSALSGSLKVDGDGFYVIGCGDMDKDTDATSGFSAIESFFERLVA